MPPNLKRELLKIKTRMQQPSRMPQGISDTEAIEWLQQQQDHLQNIQLKKKSLSAKHPAILNRKSACSVR